jgi:NAD(P)H-hydrate epimerase
VPRSDGDWWPLLTAAEMRAADAALTRDHGLPSLLLMENAGRGVADIVRRELRASGHDERDAPVAIVCGAGANGGDGFTIARHLATVGLAPRVFLAAPRAKVQGDAAVMLRALEALRTVPIGEGTAWNEEAWRARLADAAVVVDAIFGTGFRGELTGAPGTAIAAMNATEALKLAVDIPSGLDADTGRAAAAFRANVTATMGARKIGLLLDDDERVGRLEVVDLGAPVLLPDARCHLLHRDGIAARAPRRARSAHKGSSGHLLVVAGSAGKTGAALLVGQAALRAGAGLVTVASTAAGQAALDAKVLEVMTARYADGDDADAGSAAALANASARASALAVGPGMPTGPGARALVRDLAATATLPMVIDADGLNALGTDAASVLAKARAPRVLTPHPGEMARLLGIAIGAVQEDRLGHARALATASKAVVVLKGARTVVAAPDGHAYINPAACAALATAGSGDVLTGVTGAMLARGLDALTAAEVAVFVHGAAGEELGEELGDGTAAGDLPLAIARVLRAMAREARGDRRSRPSAG